MKIFVINIKCLCGYCFASGCFLFAPCNCGLRLHKANIN